MQLTKKEIIQKLYDIEENEGKIMRLKYAKGYCHNHNCLLCAHDLKCKSCWKCKHFTEDFADII